MSMPESSMRWRRLRFPRGSNGRTMHRSIISMRVDFRRPLKRLEPCLFSEVTSGLPDIGCGIGGPARYLAKRFGCRVSGVDITQSFVEAANKLTTLLKMERQVEIELGDGQHLSYGDAMFDGGYTQHVTMNIADRALFFGGAFRVLKPGAFFAVTEHGLGPEGSPHYPVPWSEDGSGSYLVRPADTVTYLKEAGFVDVEGGRYRCEIPTRVSARH